MKKKIILIGLNEINFSYVEEYIKLGYLPAFKKLFSNHGYKKTISENEYQLLEPWIQWVSIHTGKMYNEHKVFRLGDIAERDDLKQLWEIAEEKGLSVGAVSPFNAKNNLKKPLFFVPDPWTKTTVSGDKTLRKMSEAVSAAVNENANDKLNFATAKNLLAGILKYVPASRYPHYVKLGLFRLKRKATKAAILDNILADVFITLWKKYKPDFSSLFLNAGAHEQHHYMFNSKVYKGEQQNPEWYIHPDDDPLLDILTEYDSILNKLMQLNCRLFIATGLHQNPHLHNTFYWRLKDHAEFLRLVGINNYAAIHPRMSRDFLVNFNSASEAAQAQEKLKKITLNNIPLFDIDNREKSLFIELVYDNNIEAGSFIKMDDAVTDIDLKKYVSFVAIKNGEHDGTGYLIDTANQINASDTIMIKDVFNEIVNSFN
jgi:hypothetical protein